MIQRYCYYQTSNWKKKLLKRNLPNRRTLGKQNPYCIARVGHRAERSPADIRGGQMPAWDHEVRFDLKDMKEHRVLKLSVLDENDSKPELIGDTVIMLEKALNSPPSEGHDAWHELEYRGKYAGEVYLETTFYPAKPHIPPKKKRAKQKKQRPNSALEMSTYSRPLPSHPNDSTTGPTATVSSSSNASSSNGGYDLAYEFENLSVANSRSRPPPPPPPQQQPYYYYPQEQDDYNNTGECFCEDCNVENHQQLPFLPTIPPGPPEDSYYPPSSNNRARSASPQPQSQRKSVSPQPQPQQATTPPPPNRRVQRKPVGGEAGGQVRRKPVNSGLPHTPEFDEGVDPMPFSADSYNNQYSNGRSNSTPPYHVNSDNVLDINTYAPEPVRKRNQPQQQTVDPGLAGYNGEGQWDITRKINDGYGDSIFNRVIRNNVGGGQRPQKPELPPKIPMGMSREEYLAAEQQHHQEDPYYYRTYV